MRARKSVRASRSSTASTRSPARPATRPISIMPMRWSDASFAARSATPTSSGSTYPRRGRWTAWSRSSPATIVAHTYGVLPIAMNEYPLARGRVRYRGEPVAAVAAIDAETAERALALIDFEVKELPAYYTSEAARAPDAVLLHDNKPGNIERDVHHEFGDVAPRFCRRRSGARRTVQLRRDQSRADRAARESGRIRSGRPAASPCRPCRRSAITCT